MTGNKYIWFYLIHKDKGIVEIPNPIGWKEGNRSRKREKNHSISIIIGNSLEYYGLALDIIKDLRKNKGVDEPLELLCQTRSPLNPKERQVVYRGFLDLSTYEIKDKKCKVKFAKKTLEKNLKSNQSTKIELEREETLIGTVASTLATKDILLKGRSLFLESKLVAAIDPESNVNANLRTPYIFDIENRRTTTGSLIITSKIGYPLNIKYSSHPDDVTAIQAPPSEGGLITSTSGGGQYLASLVESSIFTQSEFDRVININLDLKFDLDHGTSDEFYQDTFKVILRQHSQTDENLIDYNEPEYTLFERTYTSSNYTDNIHIVSDKEINLLKGDSLSLHIEFKSHLGNDAGDEWSRCNIAFQESTVTIKEANTTPERIRKTIKAYDFGNRLIELITGKSNLLHSPILETGIWKNITLSSGLWVRGFYGKDYNISEDEADNPNDRQRIKASLKDFIEFCDAKLGLGVSYKTINSVEKICFEEKKKKYRNKALITLDKQPFNFGRKVATNLLYTGCKFGDKFADVDSDSDLYEELYGLSEYNTLSEWTTELNIKPNIYSKVSPYRSDGTGTTLALKKSIEDYPNTDTRFDDSIFMFHVKDISSIVIEERTWQDDFTEAPKNIYSPDDATNLLFTPKQMFKRHDFLFNSELKESIKYLSGRGNNSIVTVNNGINVIENEPNVNIAETSRQLFYAEEISFSYPYDSTVVSQINGQTIINGEEVLNVHGLIQFKNEEGFLELGYLKEVKEDAKLEFKIIAINPITKEL
jgi:hypothetical protein